MDEVGDERLEDQRIAEKWENITEGYTLTNLVINVESCIRNPSHSPSLGNPGKL